MKRFVLFVLLVGTAVYLFMPQRKPLEGGPEVISTVQDQALTHDASGPLTSSWGSSLQNSKQDPQVAWASSQQAAPTEITGSIQTVGSGPRHIREKGGSQPAGQAEPSGELDQASAPTNEDPGREAVQWVKMTTAVKTRSAAAIDSPALRSYAAGSIARVVGQENGWIQLLDPTNQEHGWVYHLYLAAVTPPTEAQLAAANKPQPVAAASPKPQKPVSRQPTRTAKPTIRTADPVKVTKAKRAQKRAQKVRRAERRRGFGLFKRRKAQRAWSLGR
jgi:hypothetical protein